MCGNPMDARFHPREGCEEKKIWEKGKIGEKGRGNWGKRWGCYNGGEARRGEVKGGEKDEREGDARESSERGKSGRGIEEGEAVNGLRW